MSIKKQFDIYSGPGDQEQPAHNPLGNEPAPEHGRRAYLQNRAWSFILGLIVLVFATAIIWLLIQNQRSLEPNKSANQTDILRHSNISSSHLSAQTDWVINFREPLDATIKDVQFNTYWLKRAAYHVITGEQAYRDQNWTTAREHFNQALQIFPDVKDVCFPLGHISLREENYDEAIELFEKAAEQDEMTYKLASSLGAACLAAEAYKKAEKYMQMAVTLQPNTAEAYKNLAVLYQKNKDIKQAALYFEKYLALAPDDMDAMQSYAMFMTANGQWAKAAALLRKLNTKFPEVAPLFFLRAQVESQLGNSTAAINALQRGIKLVDSSYALGWLSKEDFNALRTSEAFQNLSTEADVGTEK